MTEDYTSNRFSPKDQAPTKWDLDRCIIWDVESHDWSDPLVIGALLPDGSYREFSDNPIQQFGDFAMQSKFRNHRFISHNGGGYDHGFILDYLIEYCNDVYEWNALDTQGDIFYIEVRDEHDKPRYFQDSIKLMPRSLERLSESFADKPKLEPDHVDIRNLPESLTQLTDNEREELSEYLKRDCVALRHCLESFTKIIEDLTDGKVSPQLTVAGTSMASYQCYFMQDESITGGIPQPTPEIEEKMRESYYGGRTEVFKQRAYESDGPFYHYDVNSLFPHAYTNFRLPTGKPHTVTNPNTDILEYEDMGGAVKITGEVKADSGIPVLPNRYKPPEANSEKVLFPTGPVSGWYSMREVRYAKKIGQLTDLKIEEAIISKLEYAFKKFGTELYNLKSTIDSQENPARYDVVKFCLNAIYGRFGMKRQQSQIQRTDPNSEDYPPQDARPIGGNRNREIELWHKGVHESEENAEANYIIPRIASAITAQARIEMHKWFMQVHELGGNIWYCDTDSIVTDVKLPEKYVGEDLGLMDHENTVSKGVFCRPKTYAEINIDDENTIKGKGMRDINADTQYNDPLTAQDMIDAFDNHKPEKIASTWRGPEGLKQALKKQEGGITVKKYSRSLSGFDDKRNHINPTTSIPLDMGALWRKETEKAQADHVRKETNQMNAQAYGKNEYVSDPRAEFDSTLSAAENKREAFKNAKAKMRNER